jgi:flavin reductase (DIM6/NTAB) family NADH-FMN oxidoreductase RutF
MVGAARVEGDHNGVVTEPLPGAWIHATDPFATPNPDRSPVRRLRGRLPAAVTLWTARTPVTGGDGTGDDSGGGGRPAGLTVSSTLIVDGDPGRMLGIVDPESDLWWAVEASGRFAVAPLGPKHRQLADRFAGILPAPGGPFRGEMWSDTPYGPVLEGVGGWAGCRLDDARPLGWGVLVEATIERVSLGEDAEPLVYYRGRYRGLPDRR